LRKKAPKINRFELVKQQFQHNQYSTNTRHFPVEKERNIVICAENCGTGNDVSIIFNHLPIVSAPDGIISCL